MQRQLVQHGKSTLMVSLPKRWVDQQRLGKGDAVNLAIQETKIVLSPLEISGKEQHETAHIAKAEYDDVRETLGRLYRKGAKEITLTYDDPKTIYYIQLLCNALHGFEIIDQDERGCMIKNFVKEFAIPTNDLVRKIINLIRGEFLIVREHLEEGNRNKMQDLHIMRDDCWKYRNLVYVQLREGPLFSGHDEYLKVHLLEYNASFLYWLYRSFARSKLESVSAQFLALYDGVAEYFTQVNRRMLTKADDFVEYVMENRDRLLNECEQYTMGGSDDRFLAIYLSMLVQNIHNPKSLIA